LIGGGAQTAVAGAGLSGRGTGAGIVIFGSQRSLKILNYVTEL